MIIWKKLVWFQVLAVLIACNSSPSQESILKKPPFAAVTDSIERFPDNTSLRLKRAVMLSQNDLHELANEDIETVWAVDSSEDVALIYVSNLFLLNRPRDAVKILERGIERFPDNPEFRRRLSETLLEAGRSGEALAQYEKMLQADSTNFEAWYEKGILLMQMNDTAGAINALARSYALQPLSMNGVALANLYAETKDARAIPIADELIAKDSTNTNLDPIFIKGIYYSNTGQHQLAMEQFEKCIRTDWKFTDAYIEKGILLYEIKNIDEALETFKMAATVSPVNADAYFWQGRCYEVAGKKEEAVESYSRAYSLDRSFREAKERLDNLRNK